MITHIYKRAFYKKKNWNIVKLDIWVLLMLNHVQNSCTELFLVIISYGALNITNYGRNMGQYSGAKVSKGPFCLEFA